MLTGSFGPPRRGGGFGVLTCARAEVAKAVAVARRVRKYIVWWIWCGVVRESSYELIDVVCLNGF